jgi:hypothetical protein
VQENREEYYYYKIIKIYRKNIKIWTHCKLYIKFNLCVCVKIKGDDTRMCCKHITNMFKGFWWWCIFLDITYFWHHPSPQAKEPTVFWRMNQSPPSNRKGRGRPYSGRLFWKSWSPSLDTRLKSRLCVYTRNIRITNTSLLSVICHKWLLMSQHTNLV